MSAYRLRLQPVDATHWLNRSAGALEFDVFLRISRHALIVV
jgi:hypothetical protein